MSLKNDLQNIYNVKNDIKSAIESKLSSSIDLNFVNYPDYINNISSEGGINVPNWDLTAMLDDDITGIQSVNINNISNYYMLQSNNDSVIVNGFRFTNGYLLYLNNIKYINIDTIDRVNNRTTYLDVSKSNYLTDIYINNVFNGRTN